MKYDSDEKIIKSALNTIQTPEYNITTEIAKILKTSKVHRNFKRPIFIAICLSLIFSISVIAATIPSFNNLLSIVSPDIAIMLQPINVSSEDNGIKMEVVATMNDNESAVIFVTIQDLVGDRIDETIDIYDFSFNGAHMYNAQVVHYDETTKTATLRMIGNGGQKLNNKKINLRIRSFLSGRQEINVDNIGINLLDIENVHNSKLTLLDMNNIPGGGGDLYPYLKEQGKISILKTDQINIPLPGIDFAHISNIGYIEDRLHVQVKWIGDGVDDHGYFYFVDSKGNRVDINAGRISFGTDKLGNTEYGNEYNEYIFDIDNINLEKLELMGYFVTNDNYTTGNWKSTFKLESVIEEKEKNCNIKFDTWEVNSISVSPMGITLVGSGEKDNLDNIAINVNMANGSSKTLNLSRYYGKGKDIIAKFIFDLPIDVQQVESISVNNTLINFN